MDKLRKNTEKITGSDEMTKYLITKILLKKHPKKRFGTALLALGMHLTAKYLNYQSMRSLHQIYHTDA